LSRFRQRHSLTDGAVFERRSVRCGSRKGHRRFAGLLVCPSKTVTSTVVENQGGSIKGAGSPRCKDSRPPDSLEFSALGKIADCYNHAVGEQAAVNSLKVQANTTSDAAFDAEARRMGAVFFRRQLRGGLGLVVGVLIWFAAVVGCVILMPRTHPDLNLLVLFGGCLLGVVPLNSWVRHSKASLHRLLAVKCPQCGGAARFETGALPDTHIYMVCPECGRRADTGFSVPRNWRAGGRYSMFYDWETRKMIGPEIIVHLRQRGGGRKKS
jgi:hypothetical protein